MVSRDQSAVRVHETHWDVTVRSNWDGEGAVLVHGGCDGPRGDGGFPDQQLVEGAHAVHPGTILL